MKQTEYGGKKDEEIEGNKQKSIEVNNGDRKQIDFRFDDKDERKKKHKVTKDKNLILELKL